MRETSFLWGEYCLCLKGKTANFQKVESKFPLNFCLVAMTGLPEIVRVLSVAPMCEAVMAAMCGLPTPWDLRMAETLAELTTELVRPLLHANAKLCGSLIQEGSQSAEGEAVFLRQTAWIAPATGTDPCWGTFPTKRELAGS